MDPRQFVRVHDALAERIADGTLPAGSRLSIGLIAGEFGVGRDTVQRAIQMLADAGSVERWPGLGWYVKDRE